MWTVEVRAVTDVGAHQCNANETPGKDDVDPRAIGVDSSAQRGAARLGFRRTSGHWAVPLEKTT